MHVTLKKPSESVLIDKMYLINFTMQAEIVRDQTQGSVFQIQQREVARSALVQLFYICSTAT